ncbi:hypothetical protein ACOSP7_026992 [Xanthoceras sorbifolium]|uniref:Transmembrane protein n=1 Tax=Xanthoceras sorbifolium TaxID=99658 RepID=A0ABQ8HFD3_9ROSI|nr:hypothetical protein JRO89_XS11G0120900 [Xanthoceras sorbifolium]
MYRSVSWSRVSEDYFTHSSPKVGSGPRISSSSSSMDGSELPLYDPVMDLAKKEKRDKLSENAVHLIPFVLLFCAFVLWFFSNPDIEMGVTVADSVAARIEGLTIEGDMDTDSDGTQTSILPLETVEVDNPKQPKHHRKDHNYGLKRLVS